MRRQPSDQCFQRVLVTRADHGGFAHMEVQVDIAPTIGPPGVTQPQRDIDQPPAQGRQEMQALSKELLNIPAHQCFTTAVGVIQHSQAGYVGDGSAVLGGEEHAVETGEGTHVTGTFWGWADCWDL